TRPPRAGPPRRRPRPTPGRPAGRAPAEARRRVSSGSPPARRSPEISGPRRPGPSMRPRDTSAYHPRPAGTIRLFSKARPATVAFGSIVLPQGGGLIWPPLPCGGGPSGESSGDEIRPRNGPVSSTDRLVRAARDAPERQSQPPIGRTAYASMLVGDF